MPEDLVTLEQLQEYHNLFMEYIDAEALKSYKTITYNEQTRTIKFYKKDTATGIPDFSVTIPSEIDDTHLIHKVTDAVVNDIAVFDTDGSIKDSLINKDDIITADVLSTVATTGKAVDVSITDTAEKFIATNVENALVELVDKITINSNNIGDIEDLTTTATDLVSAINEVKSETGVTSVGKANNAISISGTSSAPTVGVKLSQKSSNLLSINNTSGTEGLLLDSSEVDYSVDVVESHPVGLRSKYNIYQAKSGLNVDIEIPNSYDDAIDISYDNSDGVLVAENVQDAIDELGDKFSSLPKYNEYKGTLGVGGTITDLPSASSSNKGHEYIVVTDGTYDGIDAHEGDMFISNGTAWTLIPSGNESALHVGYNNAASGLSSTNVQNAIDEVLYNIPENAYEISINNNSNGMTASNVQDAIDSICTDILPNTKTVQEVNVTPYSDHYTTDIIYSDESTLEDSWKLYDRDLDTDTVVSSFEPTQTDKLDIGHGFEFNPIVVNSIKIWTDYDNGSPIGYPTKFDIVGVYADYNGYFVEKVIKSITEDDFDVEEYTTDAGNTVGYINILFQNSKKYSQYILRISECKDSSYLRLRELRFLCNKNTIEYKIASTDLLETKVDKIAGKQLSTNDFTDTYKTRLDGIEPGAQANVQADWNQTNSSSDSYIKNKPNITEIKDLDKYPSSIVQDESDLDFIPTKIVYFDYGAIAFNQSDAAYSADKKIWTPMTLESGITIKDIAINNDGNVLIIADYDSIYFYTNYHAETYVTVSAQRKLDTVNAIGEDFIISSNGSLFLYEILFRTLNSLGSYLEGEANSSVLNPELGIIAYKVSGKYSFIKIQNSAGTIVVTPQYQNVDIKYLCSAELNGFYAVLNSYAVIKISPSYDITTISSKSGCTGIQYSKINNGLLFISYSNAYEYTNIANNDWTYKSASGLSGIFNVIGYAYFVTTSGHFVFDLSFIDLFLKKQGDSLYASPLGDIGGTSVVEITYAEWSVLPEKSTDENLYAITDKNWLARKETIYSDAENIKYNNTKNVKEVIEENVIDYSIDSTGNGITIQGGYLGGGGSGTSDYNNLTNKPSINSVTLSGNLSLSDLGIIPNVELTGEESSLTSIQIGNQKFKIEGRTSAIRPRLLYSIANKDFDTTLIEEE